jgi:hypothetical protein
MGNYQLSDLFVECNIAVKINSDEWIYLKNVLSYF